jgi:hypothetical protein
MTHPEFKDESCLFSTRLMPGNIHPNSFFAGSPACASCLFGFTININPPIGWQI